MHFLASTTFGGGFSSATCSPATCRPQARRHKQQTRASRCAPRKRLFQRRGEVGAHRMSSAPQVLLRGRRLNVLHAASLGQERSHAGLERLQARKVGRAQSQVLVDADDFCRLGDVLEDRVRGQRAVWIQLARHLHQRFWAASSAVRIGSRVWLAPCRRVADATMTSRPHSPLRRRETSWMRCICHMSSAMMGSPKTTRSRSVSVVGRPSRTWIVCTSKVGLRAVAMYMSTAPKSEGGTSTSSARPLAIQASYARFSCSSCSCGVPPRRRSRSARP